MIANPPIEQAQDLLARLSRADQARVLAWLAHDLTDAFPGIETQPGVCGGEPCITGTVSFRQLCVTPYGFLE